MCPVDAATFKYGMSEDESIKQPSRSMEDDLSGHVTAELSTPDFLHPGVLSSSKLKQQQIRAKRIKKNVNTKTEASDLASTGTPTTPRNGLASKMNGSADSSSLGNRNRSIPNVCGETPKNESNNATSEQARGPCQAGFLTWNPIPGQEARNPCVKSIVRFYFANREEIVTEFACRKASIYCRQTSGGMGRCQPIKVDYPALGKILTVGCKCHP